MTPKELARLAKLGGPGLSGYAFNADVLCVDCGHAVIDMLADGLAPFVDDASEIADLTTDELPNPIFFGESPDCAQHCADCGIYLYGSSGDEEVA